MYKALVSISSMAKENKIMPAKPSILWVQSEMVALSGCYKAATLGSPFTSS
jgi:hypothetical protein